MADHFWVEMKYTPVEAELMPNGSLNVHATHGAIAVADEEAKYGCWFCFIELEPESFGTECTFDPSAGGGIPGMVD